MDLKPNKVQAEALVQLQKKDLSDKGIVVIPVGVGKSFLSVLWFKDILKSDPKAKLLFICHNRDILEQVKEREFQRRLGDHKISYGFFHKDAKYLAQVCFATAQTLYRHLDGLDSDHFDYVIVDEVHHYQARTYRKVIEHLDPKFLLGLTATPYRCDKRDITDVCGKVIYESATSDAIKEGLLSKIKYFCMDDDIDYSKIRWKGKSYDEVDLNRKICVSEYDSTILNAYKKTVIEDHGRKKTICFCATIEHCVRMERLFNEAGIDAVSLTCKIPSGIGTRYTLSRRVRRQVISEFREGRHDIIFVCDMFNEGIDIPDTDSIMFLRPTDSYMIFTQQLGRGLRVSPDKDYLLVLDFTGNSRRCNINIEVLSSIIDCDIIKMANLNKLACDSSDLPIASNGCEITLTSKKLDILRQMNRQSSRQELVDSYFLIKDKLGKQPTITDMNTYGGYTQNQYTVQFGGWNRFLEAVGEPVNKISKASETELIDAYYGLKDRLGRPPTSIDMNDKGSFNAVSYSTCFGTWNRFLKKIGEPVKIRKVSAKVLVEAYSILKSELGRQPTTRDINEHGQYSMKAYRSHFGTWNAFLESVGDPCLLDTGISEDRLVTAYADLKKRLKRSPTSIDMNLHGDYHSTTYAKHFGSWQRFMQEFGKGGIDATL